MEECPALPVLRYVGNYPNLPSLISRSSGCHLHLPGAVAGHQGWFWQTQGLGLPGCRALPCWDALWNHGPVYQVTTKISIWNNPCSFSSESFKPCVHFYLKLIKYFQCYGIWRFSTSHRLQVNKIMKRFVTIQRKELLNLSKTATEMIYLLALITIILQCNIYKRFDSFVLYRDLTAKSVALSDPSGRVTIMGASRYKIYF